MTGFTETEYRNRIKKLVNFVNNNDLDGYLVFNPYNIFYYGLYYYPGKRPAVLYIHKTGEVHAFTPKMELHGAKKVQHFDMVHAYEDVFNEDSNLYDFIKTNIDLYFPDVKHIATDELSLEGYKKTIRMFESIKIKDQVAIIRQIKSKEEADMLRRAAFYSDYIIKKGKEMLKPGVTEIGLLNRMITETVDKMIQDGEEVIYVPGGPAAGLVPSGARTAMPHGLPSARVVQEGDTIILSCGANIWGYRVECERTFFVGKPDKERIKAFEAMVKAQQLTIDLMKPGAICEDIDKRIIEFITDSGYGKYIRHRAGHGKGLEEHEEPYVAVGDKTIMQPGMIFSSEPGIYIEGLSGFRHSDTVLITETGNEVITKYPKDLDSVTVNI